MVELTGVALILGGGVLLAFGAALSVYGVALLGAVLGGGAGYLVAPTIGGAIGLSGAVASLAAVAIGVVAGVLIAYTVLSMVVAIAGFAVGSLLGVYIVSDLAGVSGMLPKAGVALGTGILLAFLAMFLTKTALIGITAFLGASFASTQLTVGSFETAASDLTVDPLVVSLENPIFLGLFALGVLTQFGLFKLGWVGKIAGALPGASVIRDRGEQEPAS
ncbi:phosphate ABC transporter permease [Salinarchaeum sp. Harcht-Bsk1]|uniref:hypothetical protein n=1 Tax=Salinarchaeum sp. Harcht-Bsk1 TaxID=1333523 RepID=UPI0003422B21|nr:hypothetical protein [Salinarchaeum sp. Harcht-Bsk1]AGN01950.1 phosphate ABC transporter permease [Salinarchaeum sp. Harcht-Bsk1]